MRIRPVAVAGSALVLALLAGLVVVLLLDRGPDPDSPGYTSGQTRWRTPLTASGELVLDDVFGLPASTCLRWQRRSILEADVSWRGSRADARVELRDTRVRQASFSATFLDGCDGAPLPDEVLPTRLVTISQIGGYGPTTCDWTFSRRPPDSALPAWCGEEEYAADRIRQRLVPDRRDPSRWTFDIYGSGAPVSRWQGEATADGDDEDGFSAPLCFRVETYWDILTERDATAASSGIAAPRQKACVDLWEPTPWGDDNRS